MRLVLDKENSDGEPKARLQRIIDKTFEVVSKELGLDKIDRDITVTYEEDISQKTGSRHAIAAVASDVKSDDEPIRMTMRRAPAYVIMLALAHELVHVSQVATGRLKAVVNDEKKTAYQTWEGDKVNNAMLSLLKMFGGDRVLPWEEEAYSRMDELFLKAFDQLDPADRLFVIKSSH